MRPVSSIIASWSPNRELVPVTENGNIFGVNYEVQGLFDLVPLNDKFFEISSWLGRLGGSPEQTNSILIAVLSNITTIQQFLGDVEASLMGQESKLETLQQSFNHFKLGFEEANQLGVLTFAFPLHPDLEDAKKQLRFKFPQSSLESAFSKQSELLKEQCCATIDFTYSSDFDTNGLFYWLGTVSEEKRAEALKRGFKRKEKISRKVFGLKKKKPDEKNTEETANVPAPVQYENPAKKGIVKVTYSHNPKDKDKVFQHEDILEREPLNFFWGGSSPQWVVFDLGVNKMFRCTEYTLRHGYHDPIHSCYLRNWRFEGSHNAVDWKVLHQETGVAPFKQGYATATFKTVGPGSNGFFRYFRIVEEDKGDLVLNGVELYGTLTEWKQSRRVPESTTVN